MSCPPLDPEQTPAGIALDPHTLERVVPESRRADGSVRKQLKIRPGFTPQEDVRRFRGTRQAQMDASALPKGHIIGWVPPTTNKANTQGSAPLSKSAKKNAKRKEKREEKRAEAVKDNWEDEDEEGEGDQAGAATKTDTTKDASTTDGLTEKMEKLNV